MFQIFFSFQKREPDIQSILDANRHHMEQLTSNVLQKQQEQIEELRQSRENSHNDREKLVVEQRGAQTSRSLNTPARNTMMAGNIIYYMKNMLVSLHIHTRPSFQNPGSSTKQLGHIY